MARVAGLGRKRTVCTVIRNIMSSPSAASSAAAGSSSTQPYLPSTGASSPSAGQQLSITALLEALGHSPAPPPTGTDSAAAPPPTSSSATVMTAEDRFAARQAERLQIAAVAAEKLLSRCTVKLLTKVEQFPRVDQVQGSWSLAYLGKKSIKESGEIISLEWSGGKSAVVCLTECVESYDPSFRTEPPRPWEIERTRPPTVNSSASLLVLNEKQKLQPCFIASSRDDSSISFTERTQAGLHSLEQVLVRSSAISRNEAASLGQSGIVSLLLARAQAHVGRLQADPEAQADPAVQGCAERPALHAKMTRLKESIQRAGTRQIGGSSLRRPLVSIGFSGVQLGAWTAKPWKEEAAAAEENEEEDEDDDVEDEDAETLGAGSDAGGAGGDAGGAGGSGDASKSKRKGKSKAAAAPKPKKQKTQQWTEATLQIVQALQTVCPPEKMAKPKPMFKMGNAHHARHDATHDATHAHARSRTLTHACALKHARPCWLI